MLVFVTETVALLRSIHQSPLLNVMRPGLTDSEQPKPMHSKKKLHHQHSLQHCALNEPYCTCLGILDLCTGLHCVGSIAFYAMTHIMLCNPCVIYHPVINQHLQCTARLVGAVIVAMVTVHVPLPQLFAFLVLLTAIAVAVAVVSRRRRPLPVLLVVPMILVMTVSMLFGATVRHIVPVNECHSSLSIVQGLEVVVVVAVDDDALRHHLQVGSDAVVAGTFIIAEVDDAAFIGALVRRLDPRKAEFMGDVASYNLHDLAMVEK